MARATRRTSPHAPSVKVHAERSRFDEVQQCERSLGVFGLERRRFGLQDRAVVVCELDLAHHRNRRHRAGLVLAQTRSDGEQAFLTRLVAHITSRRVEPAAQRERGLRIVARRPVVAFTAGRKQPER
jgi:hypothetical protein